MIKLRHSLKESIFHFEQKLSRSPVKTDVLLFGPLDLNELQTHVLFLFVRECKTNVHDQLLKHLSDMIKHLGHLRQKTYFMQVRNHECLDNTLQDPLVLLWRWQMSILKRSTIAPLVATLRIQFVLGLR